jgi:HlyD family secretion protein
MKLRYWLPVVLLAALGYAGWKLLEIRNQPPEVNFVRAIRETISSSVSTNGVVEPEEWAAAKSEIAGPVSRILAQLRQRVAAGAALVEIDTAQAQADVRAVEARMEQIRTEYALLDQGGRAADQLEIQNQIEATTLALEQARRDYNSLLNLQAKGAALRVEVDAAKDRVDTLTQQLNALRRRPATLVEPSARSAIDARLREAEIQRDAARLRIQKSTVRAPIGGVIYQFDLKPGAYLNPGDTVATIGVLSRVRIKVYVDEPDLGRVKRGMPVTITWDAVPGREWTGVVDRLPVEIVPLGTRQVGEVICIIPNPEGDLIPGTNVNAVILSEKVEGAITIAKEALFRLDGQTGVYVLNGDKLTWRTVTQGVSNVTRTQVRELQEGDAVAIPGGRALGDGMVVRPVVR